MLSILLMLQQLLITLYYKYYSLILMVLFCDYSIRNFFLGHVVAVCGNLRKPHLLQQICSTGQQIAAKRPNIKPISAFCTLQKSNYKNRTNHTNHINHINRINYINRINLINHTNHINYINCNYINYIIIYIA